MRWREQYIGQILWREIISRTYWIAWREEAIQAYSKQIKDTITQVWPAVAAGQLIDQTHDGRRRWHLEQVLIIHEWPVQLERAVPMPTVNHPSSSLIVLGRLRQRRVVQSEPRRCLALHAVVEEVVVLDRRRRSVIMSGPAGALVVRAVAAAGAHATCRHGS